MTREEAESQKPFLSIQGRDDTSSIPIFFQEDWQQGIGGGLWSTGLAFGKYLTTPHAASNLQKISSTIAASSSSSSSSSSSKKEEGISVLELGSGNGLLSVCLLALAKHLQEEEQSTRTNSTCTSVSIIKDLVITDLQDHLPLIQKTLDANQHLNSSSSSSSTTTTNVHVMEHNWGKFTELPSTVNGEEPSASFCQQVQSGQCQFDLIIGSDVAYHPDLYDILITSLSQYANFEKTTILIGVTMNDTKPEFFHKLHRAGFQYQKFADHLLDRDFRGRTFGIFSIQKKE